MHACVRALGWQHAHQLAGVPPSPSNLITTGPAACLAACGECRGPSTCPLPSPADLAACCPACSCPTWADVCPKPVAPRGEERTKAKSAKVQDVDFLYPINMDNLSA